MNIRERWVNVLYRAATGTKKPRTLLTPIGVMIFGLFTALFVLLAVLLDGALALRWPIPITVSGLASVPMMAIGVGITAWAVFHFLKVKGTPVPFNPPPTLVESGPYKYARNPMLTGVFLLLFGIGFAIRSPSLVLIFQRSPMCIPSAGGGGGGPTSFTVTTVLRASLPAFSSTKS